MLFFVATVVVLHSIGGCSARSTATLEVILATPAVAGDDAIEFEVIKEGKHSNLDKVIIFEIFLCPP
jgi:hypothetical protein